MEVEDEAVSSNLTQRMGKGLRCVTVGGGGDDIGHVLSFVCRLASTLI